MEDFLNESEAGQSILLDHMEEKSLTKSNRKKLFNLLCDYLLEKYDEPPTDDVKAMCVELVNIFPCLKHSPSKMNGIVISYCVLLR